MNKYVRGHKCPRLFYLEVTDFVDDDSPVLPDSAATQEEEPPLISLNAITGVQMTNFMNERPVISLDAITGVRTSETASSCSFGLPLCKYNAQPAAVGLHPAHPKHSM